MIEGWKLNLQGRPGLWVAELGVVRTHGSKAGDAANGLLPWLQRRSCWPGEGSGALQLGQGGGSVVHGQISCAWAANRGQCKSEGKLGLPCMGCCGLGLEKTGRSSGSGMGGWWRTKGGNPGLISTKKGDRALVQNCGKKRAWTGARVWCDDGGVPALRR